MWKLAFDEIGDPQSLVKIAANEDDRRQLLRALP